MKRPMMPPPPPLIQPGHPKDKLVYVRQPSPDTSYLESQMRKARLQNSIRDLRADIAATEMRQERHRLLKQTRAISETRKRSVVNTTEGVYIKDEIAKLRSMVQNVRSVTTIGKDESFIASLGGKKVHKVDCTFVHRMPKENRVSFNELKEAQEHGYTPCKKCCTVSDDSLLATKKGKYVHFASCPASKGIKESNKLTFTSTDEAFKLGYSPCKLCMRHEDTVKETKVTKIDSHKQAVAADARRTTRVKL